MRFARSLRRAAPSPRQFETRDLPNSERRRVGEIDRSEVADDRANARARGGGTGDALEPILRAGQAQHERQLSARREAHRADTLRVHAERRRVGPDPSDRGFNVVDLRRKGVSGTEPVLRRDRDVSPPREVHEELPALLLAALPPCAGMNDEHRGQQARGGPRAGRCPAGARRPRGWRRRRRRSGSPPAALRSARRARPRSRSKR